jgi:hypothetical protein
VLAEDVATVLDNLALFEPLNLNDLLGVYLAGGNSLSTTFRATSLNVYTPLAVVLSVMFSLPINPPLG